MKSQKDVDIYINAGTDVRNASEVVITQPEANATHQLLNKYKAVKTFEVRLPSNFIVVVVPKY